MATVAGALPRAKLVTITAEGPRQEYKLEPATNVIGRTNLAQVRLDADGVSRQHCSIVGQDGKFYLTDPGGGGETFLNGKKLGEPVALRPGDVLGVGVFRLRYEEDGNSGAV
jgi:predicted component of type VI protein secretion system